jgi:uncharacterized protein YndB with AHSA1/START domain
MANVEPLHPYLEPVRRSVSVKTGVEESFRIFTARISEWWPKSRFSISGERTERVVLDPKAGGDVYEIRDDGQSFPWGKVLVWEPPARLVLSWHPGSDPASATEVELRFTAEGAGTKVDLEHRDWTKLGERAAVVRESYQGGWATVLDAHFVPACEPGRAG